MKRSRTSKNKKPSLKSNAEERKLRNPSLMLIALIISVLSIILTSLFSMPSVDILENLKINNSSLYLILILLSVILFWGTYAQKVKILLYTFLLLLIYSLVVSLIPLSLFQDPENTILIKLKIFQSVLIFPAIFFGLILLWFKKDNLNENIEKLYGKTDRNKFKIKMLFSKNEIFFTALFLIVVGFSVYTNFYELDRFDLYSDEAQVIDGAAGYMYSGEYRQYSFSTKEIDTTKYYNRAKPHQYVLAKTFEVFGVSGWTSRFPSALFGVLLVIFAYFISRYFIKDKFAAILIIFSLAFSYEFLLLQRWARMYAMLMPVFLITFYLGYRFMTEPSRFKFINSNKIQLINSYLNYNYLILPFFIIFFWLAFNLHMNSVILLLIFFVFSLFAIPLTREKRYIFISVLGFIIILLQLIFPFNLGYRWLTFFEANNVEFYKYAFLGLPFTFETNIVFIVLIVFALTLSNNKQFIKNYLVLVSVALVGLILYSYVIKFAISFRYMSFLASLTLILVIGSSLFLVKTLFNKFVYYGLGLLIVASVLSGFNTKFDDLYVVNKVSPAKPSVAWKIITDNYKNNELLMMHWGPSVYLTDLDSGAHVQSLYKFRTKGFNEVLDTLDNYKSGWVTWHSHNGLHIHKDLIDYANLYYVKYHGYGIDNTGVEVFSYNDSLQKPLDLFNIEKNIPSANLKTDKTYSIAFTIELNEFSQGKPFFIRTVGNKDIITFKTDMNHNIFVKYLNENDSLLMQVPKDKLNHIVWYQKTENEGMTYGFYLNGEFIKSKLLKTVHSDLVKFKVNPLYNGLINDIRIYDIALNERQIKEVIKNVGKSGTEELTVNEETFRSLYHWQRH